MYQSSVIGFSFNCYSIITGPVSRPQMAVRPLPPEKTTANLRSTLPQQRSPLQPSSSNGNSSSSSQQALAAAHSNADMVNRFHDDGPSPEAGIAAARSSGNSARAVAPSGGLAEASSNGSSGRWEGSDAMPVSKSAKAAFMQVTYCARKVYLCLSASMPRP